MENPPAAYYKMLARPDGVMENTTQLFLAVRFNCNKCHDHPFERWTQDQYYQLAAYFAQVGRKEDPQFAGQKIGGTAVEGAGAAGRGDLRRRPGRGEAPNTNAVQQPSLPYQSELAGGDAAAPRAVCPLDDLAKNQYFAKSYVNRMWSYLLGVGIIEPVDDIRAGNPPTNPELLDRLTQEFIEHDFDVQHLVKRSASRGRISTRSPRTAGTKTIRLTTRTRLRGGCRPRCCTTPSIRRREACGGCRACRLGAGRAAARLEREPARRIP